MKFFKKGFYPTTEQRAAIQSINADLRVMSDGITTQSIFNPQISDEDWSAAMEQIQKQFDCFPKPHPYAQQIRYYEELAASASAEGRDPMPMRQKARELIDKAREEGYTPED